MTPLERLKELNEKATPGPWERDEYGGILDPDAKCTFDKVTIDGFALCGSQEAKSNRDLLWATRNLLHELIALWEASDKWFWKDAAYPGADTQAIAEATSALNARAEEIMK